MANATTGRQISAIDIINLWYGDTSKVTSDLTASALATLIKTLTELSNMHQDTWSYEEAEAQQETYRNQLTGVIYREGRRQGGDESVKFTIGQYDFNVKKDFLGGEVITDSSKVVGWKKTKQESSIHKVIVFKTIDNVYGVFTNAIINANSANTDKAIGIAVTGTAMENDNKSISSVYWFDGEDVVITA